MTDDPITRISMQYKDFLKIFVNHGAFQVVFLSNCPGVEIPEYLKEVEVPNCVLKFSNLFPPPYNDLELLDHGIQQTLSFNGVNFLCYVPYKAIVGIGNPDANEYMKVEKQSTFQLIKGEKDE